MRRILTSLVIGLALMIGTVSGASAICYGGLEECCLSGTNPYWCDEAVKEADPVMLFESGVNLGNRNIFVSTRFICESGARGFSDGTKKCMEQAKSGNSVAQYHLALLYMNGTGVFQDLAAAHMWSTISASKGHSAAVGIRDHALGRLRQNQQPVDFERAKRCLESKYQDCEKEAISWLDKIRKKL